MISVIIPVYNAEPYLRRCLDSVLNSTYQDFELILVNDGSTDNSFEICQEYAAKDNRIQMISQENRGVSTARNRGLDICRGEWVVFVDADDLISPDFLSMIAQEELQSQDLLLFDFAKAEAELAAVHPALEPVHFGPKEMPDLLRSLFLRRQIIDNASLNLLGPCGKAYRKLLIDHFSIRFLPKLFFGEDTLFNIEFLSKSERCSYIAAPVYYYYFHADSSSHRFNPELPYNLSKLLKGIQTALEANHLFPQLEKDFYSYALDTLCYTLAWSVFSSTSTNPYAEKIRVCRNLRKSPLYCEAIKYNHTYGDIVRRTLIFLFRLRLYPLVGLLASLWSAYLTWKSRR